MRYGTPMQAAAGVLSGASLSGGSLGILGGGMGDWTDYIPGYGGYQQAKKSCQEDPSQTGCETFMSVTGNEAPPPVDQGGGDIPVSDKAGQPCGLNMMYNSSGDCVDMGDPEGNCPSGFTYSPIHGCVPACPSGQQWVGNSCSTICTGDQVLVVDSTTPPEGKCMTQKAYIDAAAKAAACPKGSTFDPKTMKCKTASGGTIAPKAPPPTIKPAPTHAASWYTNPVYIGLALLAVGAAAVGYKKYKQHHAGYLQVATRYLEATPRLFDDEAPPTIDEVLNKDLLVREALINAGASLDMDSDMAGKGLRDAQVWLNDHKSQIDAFLASGPKANDKPPDDILLSMPQDEAQQFILGLYYYAEHGMGIYVSGYAQQLAATGKDGWSYDFMDDDLRKRRKTFNALIDMGNQGTLKRIFGPAPMSDGGLSLGAIILIITIVTLVLAAVVTCILMYQDQKRRYAIFEQACKSARETGNKQAAEMCSSIKPPTTPPDPMQNLIWAAAAVGAAYLIVAFGIPAIMRSRRGE